MTWQVLLVGQEIEHHLETEDINPNKTKEKTRNANMTKLTWLFDRNHEDRG